MFREVMVTPYMGVALLRLRSKLELLSHAIKRSISIGTVLNDQLSTFIVVRLCERDKVFMDVGSHIGSVILEVMDKSKPKKIIAFEAIPKKARKLQSKFKDADIHNCAVSDNVGQAKFFIDRKLSGYSSLNKTHNAFEISVPLNTIDNLVDRDDVDVIKIDIEGAELGALRGGINLIKKCRPVIMFESGPEEKLGYTKSDLWRFFSDQGYRIFIPNRLAHSPTGLSMEAFLESHQFPRRTTNYIAVHKSRTHEVKKKVMNILGVS